ncbi:MAG TPA: hypothetical protein VF614_06055 [Chthoniobacteraceae bacterium]
MAALLPLAQATAPAAGSNFIWKAVGLFAAMQVLSVLFNWIASKVIATEESTFLQALKTWGYYLGAFLAVCLIGGAGFFFLSNHPAGLVITVVSVVILLIAVLFQVPMKVYELSFAKALGFVAITLILNGAAQTFISKSFAGRGSPIGAALDPAAQREQISALFRQISSGRGRPGFDESIVGDPSRSLPERHAALQQIHRELQARHARLKRDDQKGIEAYQRDQARYDELVAEITAASRR